MPHERIYSLDTDPDHANNAQIAWGHPSSPSNTGPGHGNDEGHVMVVVERPGTPARMAASVEEVERRLKALLADRDNDAVQTLLSCLLGNNLDIPGLLAAAFGEDLAYAYGEPCELLAVTVDRKGCNKMISALRRGRDAAFGKDE